jgi:2-polyprenyl-3-methyl-5-hydroxy-6-metoxy-1,4-benzoquinol methylase
MLSLCAHHLTGGSPAGKRVLDLACGEGGHSLLFAQAGADVLGIDGRQLYVDRARFAAEMSGLSSKARFELGDMRELSRDKLGTFDLVIASGILHHLAQSAFYPFLRSLAALTSDACIVFTHISTPQSVQNHRLEGPVSAEGRYSGHLFREHADDASDEEKAKKVRASLDNPQSFWASEEALVAAVRDSGFASHCRMLTPTVMESWAEAEYRPLYVLRAASRSPA